MVKREQLELPEWTAELLVEWLNGPGAKSRKTWASNLARPLGGTVHRLNPAILDERSDARSRKRIVQIIGELQQLSKLTALRNRDVGAPNRQLAIKSWLQSLAAISKKLNRYRSFPSLFPPTSMETLVWLTVPDSRSAPPQEFRAVEVIADAVRRGWLDRLRRCAECQRWFVATKPWSKGCKSNCRQKIREAYQTSDEYRKRRRKNPV